MSGFYASLRIISQRFYLEVPTGVSRLANGQSIPFANGASYWRGTAALEQSRHADADYEVDLMRLMRPGETFEIFDTRFNGPRLDPAGQILGAASPVLHTLNADNRRIRISGLPGGYVLSKGDYVGVQSGAAPVRLGLYRVEATVVASGAGLTPLFAVEPHIRPGTAAGDPVQLVRPVCRARLSSASFGAGTRRVWTEGATFEWEETLQ